MSKIRVLSIEVRCDYCGSLAELVRGSVIYPHRPDMKEAFYYLCRCKFAYVGCHSGTNRPLGRLADKELRAWRTKAHAAFDPRWRRKIKKNKGRAGKARSEGYLWLAKKMGIDVNACHIGAFCIDQCKEVIEIMGANNG